MKKILILTEAGKNIGLGHYTRCSAIKDAAESKGFLCDLIVSWEGLDAPAQVNCSNWRENIYSLRNYDPKTHLIIDSYLIDAGDFVELKDHFDRVIVIDDYNRIVYPADILINPNVYFDKIDYSNQQAVCYGGSNFTILRKAFREFDSDSVKVVPDKVVVMIGGSDLFNVLPKICSVLSQIENIKPVIICPEEKVLKSLSLQFRDMEFLGRLNEKAIAEEFASAQFVVSGCGQTLHELAALGKSVIGIAVGEDQLFNQKFYLSAGFLPNSIYCKDIRFEQKLEEAFFIQRENAYSSATINSQNLIDRNGVYNLVDIAASTYPLTWREAEEHDCQQYFEWVNDSAVRESALNSELIEWEAHNVWYQRKLNSDSIMLMFFFGKNAVGQLRLDWEGSQGFIDFSVGKQFRGKGMGSFFLKIILSIGRTRVSQPVFVGIVKENNKASAYSFERAGFNLSSVEVIQGHRCFRYIYK